VVATRRRDRVLTPKSTVALLGCQHLHRLGIHIIDCLLQTVDFGIQCIAEGFEFDFVVDLTCAPLFLMEGIHYPTHLVQLELQCNHLLATTITAGSVDESLCLTKST
jgi:hypothetical protein